MSNDTRSASELAIATIGSGVIVEQFARAVAGVSGIRLAAVYSRDAERAAEFAKQNGVAQSFSDREVMFADPAIDAVYIASPNALHFEQALAAVDAGKHVLVEKTAVSTVAEWDQLTERARTAGVHVMEAIRTRYDPGLQALRDELPRIGQLSRATLRYEKRSSRYDDLLAGRLTNIFDPAMGGGVLRDLGIYCIHVMLDLWGSPSRVRAARTLVSSGADGMGSLLATYDDFLVDLHYSKISDQHLPTLFAGERGEIIVDDISAPRRIVVHTDAGSDERVIPAASTPLDAEVREFVELVRGRSDARDHVSATRRALEVLTAAQSEW